VYQFVFLSFNIFENVLARLSQHVNNIRGHVGDFIILPRVAYKTHIDHYIKGKKKKDGLWQHTRQETRVYKMRSRTFDDAATYNEKIEKKLNYSNNTLNMHYHTHFQKLSLQLQIQM